jgi:hypothetical protein
MANEIAGFGGLNFFKKIILSELIIKCVIEFDRFLRIFRGPMKMVERYQYFQCLVE